ncbi:Inositol-1-monophosphatase [hydrothermal vent metagenome]|uniref:inositol-phosphate phosphatase n=1 Tax=hydrothermal vent metagenome TaxID=652676 RepID=A0A3B0T968_9ZZZZ
MPLSPNINVMLKAARKAARGLSRDFGEVENLQVSRKGPANFVSNADRRAEEVIYEELRKARPDYGFLMEESGTHTGKDTSHRWIVDPLDGTTNFLHGLPQWCISIALERDRTIIAALVYAPMAGELFVAERGQGATLNDKRVRVSARARMSEAVFACGMPYFGHGDCDRFIAELGRIQGEVAGLRRFGSAALDLCWVAAGRYEGFWERGLGAWDIAAGALIVREAGGAITDLDGGDRWLRSGDILATNDALHQPLLTRIKG